MSIPTHTQATVITGPQGPSDVSVSHPETAPAGSIAPQPTTSIGSVPSQQISTNKSVPSQQLSSVKSVPSQQCHPQRESPTPVPMKNSTLHLPILSPTTMDRNLQETLEKFAETFVLPKDQSSPVPTESSSPSSTLPTKRILEGPRIQTVLYGIYQWVIKNRIPTESLFGDQIPCPRHPGTPLLKRDIESVRQSLPPAIQRLSSLTANLQRYGFDQEKSPRCPQLNSDYLVSSLLIPPRVPDSVPGATATTVLARPLPLPKVGPLESRYKSVQDPGDYLPFMKKSLSGLEMRMVRFHSYLLSQLGITTHSWTSTSLEPTSLE
ncbi:hypothetical protein RCL1_004916 [Eukaryota sp. TZLM3-RCL]